MMNRMRAVTVAVVIGFVLAGASKMQSQSELFNSGRQWNIFSDTDRSVYLHGFVDGQGATYFAMLNDVPQERREALRNKTFTFYDADAIRNVMTNLYSDPANTFIDYSAMVYIARDKLSGKDVEPMLRYSREHDRGYVR